MEILKADLSKFEFIKDFPYQENFVDIHGANMHYVDEGEGETVLLLHGEPSWSYLYRKVIPGLKDYQVIAPDLIGFGKSDKLVGWQNYSFDFHFNALAMFIDKLNLQDITLVVQDWGGLLGLSLLGEYPKRFKRVVVMNTLLPIGDKLPLPLRMFRNLMGLFPSVPIRFAINSGTYGKLPKQVLDAYEAPFPSKQHKDGAKAFPRLLPTHASDPGALRMKKAREVLSQWSKPALVMFSDKDPVLSSFHQFFRNLIPSSVQQQRVTIHNAGHFLQEEKGEEIARYIDQFIKGELRVKAPMVAA
ncbi:MAG: haloalkane dehalogenase [Bacteroidota bacterium]